MAPTPVVMRSPLEALLAALRAAPAHAIDPDEARDALGLLDEISAALQLPASFSSPRSGLLALPPELLVKVCQQLSPCALATAAQVCRCLGGVRLQSQLQPIVEQALRLQQAEHLPHVHVKHRMTAQQRMRHATDALTWSPYPDVIMHSPPDVHELLCDALRHHFSHPHLLCAARAHSVFLSPTGAVLTCGGGTVAGTDESDVGASLGHGPACTIMAKPEAACPIGVDGVPMTDCRFIAVAAGPFCTVAISEVGDVFSCGSSRNECLQLGRGRRADEEADEEVDGCESTLQCIGILQRSTVSDPIVAVACGLEHCLCLSERGVVRSWGVGIDGALGHGKHGGPAEASPTVVEGLRSLRVTAIAAGLRHSLALSASGVVFGWGQADALCGVSHDGRTQLHSPYPIEQLLERASHDRARLCAIAAGGAHSLALAHTGAIYSWGVNTKGQLGRPLSKEPLPPARVDEPPPEPRGHADAAAALPARVRFRNIACGVAHSVALSDAGHAYAWGDSDSGRLGVRLRAEDEQRQCWCHQAGKSPKVVVPLRVEGPRQLAHVSAGWAHTLASTHDGRVFGWGDLSDHCLPHSLGGCAVQADAHGDEHEPPLGARTARPTLYPEVLRVAVGRVL